jgi:CHAD domain-containing protein
MGSHRTPVRTATAIAAAGPVLRHRLDEVLRCLSRAAAGDDNAASVHRLRVATRRASAALDLFAELLPKQEGRRIQRKLKRIRMRAGELRDLDVHLERVKGRSKEADLYRRVLGTQRKRATERLQRLATHLQDRGFRQRCQALAAAVAWPSRHGTPPRFDAWTREKLAPAAEDFFAQSEASASALHRLRIRTKKLRYLLELGDPEAVPRQEEALAALTTLQDRLGELHDHEAAADHLRKLAKKRPKHRERFKRLLALEKARGLKAEQAFTQFWTPDVKAMLAHRLGGDSEAHPLAES